MSKTPIIPALGSNSFTSASQVNAIMSSIEEAFRNTVSRDGSIPNQLEADFDLNSNDILNAGSITTDDLTVRENFEYRGEDFDAYVDGLLNAFLSQFTTVEELLAYIEANPDFANPFRVFSTANYGGDLNAAHNAAVAAGAGIVYVARGSSTMSGVIEPVSSVKIDGAGPDVASVTVTFDGPTAFQLATDSDNISIKGFHLKLEERVAEGISSFGGRHLEFKNLKITGWKRAVEVYSSRTRFTIPGAFTIARGDVISLDSDSSEVATARVVRSQGDDTYVEVTHEKQVLSSSNTYSANGNSFVPADVVVGRGASDICLDVEVREPSLNATIPVAVLSVTGGRWIERLDAKVVGEGVPGSYTFEGRPTADFVVTHGVRDCNLDLDITSSGENGCSISRGSKNIRVTGSVKKIDATGLSIGSGFFRVTMEAPTNWAEGGIKAIDSVTAGAVTTLTTGANGVPEPHGLLDGSPVNLYGLPGRYSAISGTIFEITVIDANTFSIPFDSTGYGDVAESSGNVRYVVYGPDKLLNGRPVKLKGEPQYVCDGDITNNPLGEHVVILNRVTGGLYPEAGDVFTGPSGTTAVVKEVTWSAENAVAEQMFMEDCGLDAIGERRIYFPVADFPSEGIEEGSQLVRVSDNAVVGDIVDVRITPTGSEFEVRFNNVQIDPEVGEVYKDSVTSVAGGSFTVTEVLLSVQSPFVIQGAKDVTIEGGRHISTDGVTRVGFNGTMTTGVNYRVVGFYTDLSHYSLMSGTTRPGGREVYDLASGYDTRGDAGNAPHNNTTQDTRGISYRSPGVLNRPPSLSIASPATQIHRNLSTATDNPLETPTDIWYIRGVEVASFIPTADGGTWTGSHSIPIVGSTEAVTGAMYDAAGLPAIAGSSGVDITEADFVLTTSPYILSSVNAEAGDYFTFESNLYIENATGSVFTIDFDGIGPSGTVFYNVDEGGRVNRLFDGANRVQSVSVGRRYFNIKLTAFAVNPGEIAYSLTPSDPNAVLLKGSHTTYRKLGNN